MSTFDTIQPAKRKKEKSELWLLSYADLVTNLMALFIMMIAMSKVDNSKFDAIASELSDRKKDDLDTLKKKLDAQITEQEIEDQVTTSLGMNGLVIEFLGGVLFESASSKLSDFAEDEAKPLLQILTSLDKKYSLAFEGHTDDVPIKKGAFKDNWALSSARGVAVLQLMTGLGIPPSQMSVAGYADTRPKVDIKGKSGKQLEQARSQNRRVAIRIHL